MLGRLATAHDTLVVEDLTCLDLRLDGPPPLTVASAAPDGRVLSVGSMSKVVWGGLRVGWLRASEQTVRELIRVRGTLDLGGPLDTQVQSAWLLRHRAEILADRLPLLREQRDALGAALAAQLPEWKWRCPDGGMSSWVELPRPVAEPLRQMVARCGLNLLPSWEFKALPGEDRHLRLPFALEAGRLREAVNILAIGYRQFADDRTR